MRTVNKYSVKSLVKGAYEASTLEKACFNNDPLKDAEIKKVVSNYMRTYIESPLKMALDKMNKTKV